MHPRLTLLLVALILIGGALALWWNDGQPEPGAPDGKTGSQDVSSRPGGRSAYDGPYVLTIGWHPAFCEMKPNLPECRSERASDYAANHFSLHGLWPQADQYCGVGADVVAIDGTNRWDGLPPVDIGSATRRELERIMPGTADNLERHEWVLHGTCAGTSADTYFRRAIALVEEINASSVRELLASSIDRHIPRESLRAAFDTAFGRGAGRKVRLDCETDGTRELLSELRINLNGDAMAATTIRDLIHPARNAGAGCSGGVIDAPGEQ